MSKQTNPKNDTKDLAWVGDAVLALYTRQWLLESPPISPLSRQEMFLRMTTNQFLNSLGEPTKVEAQIGKVYLNDGLEAAFTHIENEIRPRFIKQLNNLHKGIKGSKT